MKMSPKLMKALCQEYNISQIKRDEYICEVICWTRHISLNELNDHNDIYCIVLNVISELKKHESKRIRNYQLWAFAPILFWFSMQYSGIYNPSLIESLESFVEKEYTKGRFGYEALRTFRHGTRMVKTYKATGKLCINDIPHKKSYPLGENFTDLLNLYRERHGKYFAFHDTRIDSRLGSIRVFLHTLEQRGITTVDEFTNPVISVCVTAFSKNYGGGLRAVLGNVRQFLFQLYKAGKTNVDFSEAVPSGAPRRTKIRFGFTNNEVDEILNSVNQQTVIGKRDYAMMLIVARTGLRGIDIANLRFQDIDWRLKEIKIVQQKTGIALSLPLSSEVGNAIAEYILHARSNVDIPQIFLDTCKPYNPIKPKTFGGAVTKYMNSAGAVNPDKPYRRAHAFRRNFALNLLSTAHSNDMITEILGQVEPNSSKPYLSLDENGLKDCSLTLASVRAEVQQ